MPIALPAASSKSFQKLITFSGLQTLTLFEYIEIFVICPQGKITKQNAQCCSFCLCNFFQFCPVLFQFSTLVFRSSVMEPLKSCFRGSLEPKETKAMRLFLMFAVSRKRQISPVPMKRQMQRHFCFLETRNLYSELSCASFSQISCYKMRRETDHSQNKSITQSYNNNLTEQNIRNHHAQPNHFFGRLECPSGWPATRFHQFRVSVVQGRVLRPSWTKWKERDQGQGEEVGVRHRPLLLLLLVLLGGQTGGGGGYQGVEVHIKQQTISIILVVYLEVTWNTQHDMK